MKVLHTSDWHLGQNFMGKSREEEHKAFFSWLLEIIKENQIDLLLVSGDIFDTGTPPNYALELYYNFLKQLSSIKSLTTTIITAGNHDSVSTLKAPKQLLEALNVHVIVNGDEDENIIIPIKEDDITKAIVCAVPFLRDSVIRQSLGGQTVSQKEKLATDGIKAYYEKAYNKAKELNENSPIIAMGHLTTVGSRSSESERDIYIGGTLDIGGDYLASMFDYVALGHLHINQTVGNEHVRYSGSPIPLSFSESKNTQKVNLVTIDEDVKVEELEVPLTKKLQVIKGDLETIKKELKAIEDKSTWIEVHIKDDNPMFANTEIRELATKLELTILAVKIEKSEKALRAKELKAISLDELSVQEVFEKRLKDENIENKEFKKQLSQTFNEVVSNLHQEEQI
ncbi:exonuclease SbcCD subunit D C-terminal domain-containing protein [Halarcobacter bivalviorum]|uniref:Nuclease SbcCD subunit D n=1 Tax=Halarcobacter bivalviorum TaxID=663364 RepID=A0AAX2AAT2_9BACT|nr:exonuclease SbcCD subunit D C-terminal domain-containing protein [Halarcobacter bivalviorum]AXH12018.1 DNA repair exonuclease SbcCD, nuclease subunit [Halarcobacter bivalviorum]RXK11417.1 exonuclease sbcCD subunit D [Halarcobacter bivalviorum]